MLSPGQKLILKFETTRVWLSSNHFLDLSQTNIGEGWEFYNDVIWEITVLKYFDNEERIFAKVVDYEISVVEFSQFQERVINAIHPKKISFKSLNTRELLKSAHKAIVKVDKEVKVPEFLQQDKTEKDQLEKKIKLAFAVKIKDINFKKGSLRFNKFIKELRRVVPFEIFNENIREEFDAIKNYFASYLHSKSVWVETEITFNNTKIIECITTCEDFDKINESAIETMKFDFVKKEFSKRKNDLIVDKGLFTIEELFVTLTDNKVKSNTFYASEKELLEDLINARAKKHYKQLRYLSSKHQSRILKLRFILTPFSFIFLLAGQKNYFLIWETLDTKEATYIWQFKLSIETLKVKLKEIEGIISKIGSQGKRQYLLNESENFYRIFHDYSDPTLGFLKWKGEIEAFIHSL